jgi:aminopeptidase
MSDPRINKLADVLINYSLALKPGEQLELGCSVLAQELGLAAYTEALKRGAHVLLHPFFPEERELFYKLASEAQLDYLPPVEKSIAETFDASLFIGGAHNTRHLTGVNPEKQARHRKAMAPLFKITEERVVRQEYRWCYTEYPTQATAQEADMSLADYAEFFFAAGKLNEADPVAGWQAEGRRQQQLVDWLAGREQAVLKGSDIDLSFSIKDRKFIVCAGKYNFPDGEIFTGPVENSVNGWVRFKYPAIFGGREVTDVELWFENGRVVKEKAAKNGEFLTATLNTDAGSRYLGEWGIGTNYDIPRFTRHMLFDEKLGGTIHLAVGASLYETGGRNDSGLHWDMLCDMSEGEVHVDGELFYRNGRPVLWA